MVILLGQFHHNDGAHPLGIKRWIGAPDAHASGSSTWYQVLEPLVAAWKSAANLLLEL